MFSEINRLRSYYSHQNISPKLKSRLASNGLYYSSALNCSICYECIEEWQDPSSLQAVVNVDAIHKCSILTRNIKIESPWIDVRSIAIENNDLNHEEFRISTFSKMITRRVGISIYDLAKTGFYFSESPDKIKCFYCKMECNVASSPLNMITNHKLLKKCEQKRLSAQIRIKNLSSTSHLKNIPNISKNNVHCLKKNIAVVQSPKVINEAGSSTQVTITANNQQEIMDMNNNKKSPTKAKIEEELNQFLTCPNTKGFYYFAVSLGLDSDKLKQILKRRLYFGGKIESVSELINIYFEINDNLENQSIINKMEDLQTQIECKICMERTVTNLFRPCNHLITCSTCAIKLTLCPVCRQKITEKIEAIF